MLYRKSWLPDASRNHRNQSISANNAEKKEEKEKKKSFHHAVVIIRCRLDTLLKLDSLGTGLLIVNMAAFEWDCDCGWEWDLDSPEWSSASAASQRRPIPPPPPPFFDLPPPPLPPSLQPPPELCSTSDHPLGLETCSAFLVIVQTNGLFPSLHSSSSFSFFFVFFFGIHVYL